MASIGPNDRIYPVNQISLLVELAGRFGVRTANLLEGTDLKEPDLALPSTRISNRQAVGVVANLVALVEEPNFALECGLAHHLSLFGIYGFAILTAPDFRTAARYAMQYSHIAQPLIGLSFHEHGDYAAWTLTPRCDANHGAALERFILEMHVGVGIALQRDVMGDDYAPKKIELTYRCPAIPFGHAVLKDCEVAYRQAENRVIFRTETLERPVRLRNRLAYEDLLATSGQLAEAFSLQSGTAGRVRELLLTRLGEKLDQDTVAERLGLSTRSLRRALQSEGTSFREINDDVIRILATKYLRETDISIEEIAAAVGYLEPSNFRRAFRRATGKSPCEMRNSVS